jgi:hypothetical protein
MNAWGGYLKYSMGCTVVGSQSNRWTEYYDRFFWTQVTASGAFGGWIDNGDSFLLKSWQLRHDSALRSRTCVGSGGKVLPPHPLPFTSPRADMR